MRISLFVLSGWAYIKSTAHTVNGLHAKATAQEDRSLFQKIPLSPPCGLQVVRAAMFDLLTSQCDRHAQVCAAATSGGGVVAAATLLRLQSQTYCGCNLVPTAAAIHLNTAITFEHWYKQACEAAGQSTKKVYKPCSCSTCCTLTPCCLGCSSLPHHAALVVQPCCLGCSHHAALDVNTMLPWLFTPCCLGCTLTPCCLGCSSLPHHAALVVHTMLPWLYAHTMLPWLYAHTMLPWLYAHTMLPWLFVLATPP